MADDVRLGPNRGLSFAAGLAQGAANFATNFRQGQQHQDKMAMQQAQLQGMLELRKLQMQKLREEMAPVEIDLAQYGLLRKAYQGELISEDAFNKVATPKLEQMITKVDSPQKAQALAMRLDQLTPKKGASLGMSSLNPAEGIEMPNAADYAPKSQKLTFEPKAAKMITQMLAYENQANIAAGRNQTQMGIADMNNMSKEQLTQFVQDAQGKIKQMELEARERMNRENNATRERVAKIGANRPRGGGNTAYDRLQLENMKGMRKQYNQLVGPKTGIDLRSQARMAQDQKKAAEIAAEFKRQFGRSIDGSDAAAPAPQAAPAPTPTKSTPPPAAAGPKSLKEAAKLAPVGKEFSFGGKTYFKKNEKEIDPR